MADDPQVDRDMYIQPDHGTTRLWRAPQSITPSWPAHLVNSIGHHTTRAGRPGRGI